MRFTLSVAIVSLVLVVPSRAQVSNWPSERPPQPLPARAVKFPPYEVRTLANGLQVIDGPYTKVRDPEGFREFSTRAYTLGFDGKWALHPDQVTILNDLFSPTQEDFDKALAVLDAYEAATTQGDRKGAVMFGDEMIDEASRKLAARVVEGGRRAGLAVSLYGVHSEHTWGCGDFTSLRGVIDWVVDAIGGSYIALNPLHAIHNRQPFNTSPYLPNSLYYRNFIYLDVDAMPDLAGCGEAQALRGTQEVREEIAALQRRVEAGPHDLETLEHWWGRRVADRNDGPGERRLRRLAVEVRAVAPPIGFFLVPFPLPQRAGRLRRVMSPGQQDVGHCGHDLAAKRRLQPLQRRCSIADAFRFGRPPG